MIAGLITLLSCIIFSALAKGFLKQLNVMFGLIVGYIASFIFGIVDFYSRNNKYSATFKTVFYDHKRSRIYSIAENIAV